MRDNLCGDTGNFFFSFIFFQLVIYVLCHVWSGYLRIEVLFVAGFDKIYCAFFSTVN